MEAPYSAAEGDPLDIFCGIAGGSGRGEKCVLKWCGGGVVFEEMNAIVSLLS